MRADAEAHGARARGAREALGRVVEAKSAAREARAQRQRACDEFTRATRDAVDARVQPLDDARVSRVRAMEDAKARRDAAVVVLDAETDAMRCGDATMHPGGRDRRVASSSPPIRVLYIAAARRHDRETRRETSFAYARVDVHTQHRHGIEPARLVSNFIVPSKRSTANNSRPLTRSS